MNSDLGFETDKQLDVGFLELLGGVADQGLDVLQQQDSVGQLVFTIRVSYNTVQGSHGRQDGVESECGDIFRHKV